MNGLLSTELVVEAIAMALYDTDEDIVDEAILLRWAMHGHTWRAPDDRVLWADMEPIVQSAYRRRATAALSALVYGIANNGSVAFRLGSYNFSIQKIAE